MVSVRVVARFHPKLHESLWYGADDYKNFVRIVKRTRGLSMQSGNQLKGLDDFLSSNLGLECYTPQGSRKRSDNRSEAYDAVLETQELQSLEETNDPQELADIYMKLSKDCQEEAHQIALELRRRHVEEYVVPSQRVKVNEISKRCPEAKANRENFFLTIRKMSNRLRMMANAAA